MAGHARAPLQRKLHQFPEPRLPTVHSIPVVIVHADSRKPIMSCKMMIATAARLYPSACARLHGQHAVLPVSFWC